ncbi:MAG: replication-associated recombination protein A [Bacteroidales bacterium]|jgi:putative ATPase|nr:replication-associated recombination protein A [Bacteroidales bacterium]NLO67545.1 replication-associated recombination protein A [Bacteroidales bacterium]
MASNIPLAERMRPQSLDDYAGQDHLVGPNAILRLSIESGNLPSFILWGPPGVGKTTLARIVAGQLNRPFFTLSAINSGVKDIREVIDKAQKNKFFNAPSPILFIDEIHRFSKSQQDSLLGAVEQGIVTLIGATTENPSFEVISPLLSRCQVYVLKPLNQDQLRFLLNRALKSDFEIKSLDIELVETEALFRYSGGDARKLYNVLELVIQSYPQGKILINNEIVTAKVQENIALYDKNGELHYDIISAFIKSMRGSDPNAAVYWLARMIEGGEKPEFIARRMLIFASEDIGLANPNALLLANTCFDAIHKIGWPEGRIILSETAVYLATSPKSNSTYKAIGKAQEMVAKTGNLPVPLHLRNAPTKLMKELGYGQSYNYPHDQPGHFLEEEYLPDQISGTKFWEPDENIKERDLREKMRKLWSDRYTY